MRDPLLPPPHPHPQTVHLPLVSISFDPLPWPQTRILDFILILSSFSPSHLVLFSLAV